MKKIFRFIPLFIITIVLTSCSFFSGATSSNGGNNNTTISSGNNNTTIPSGDHIAENDWDFDSEYHFHYCKNCLNQGIDHVLDKAKHTFVEKRRNNPTCNATGVVYYGCSVCGFQKEEILPKTSHSFKDEYEADNTNHWHECSVCHEKGELEAHTATYSNVVESTFDEKGSRHCTCSKCGHEWDEELPLKEHKFSDWEYDESNHWKECLDVGYTDLKSEFAAHTFAVRTVAATEENDGYDLHMCSCGYTYKDNYVSRIWSKRELNKYEGHYLVDMSEPTSKNRVDIYKKDSTNYDPKYYEFNDVARTMGGEFYNKGFRMDAGSTDAYDSWVTYSIDGGTYSSLCFALGPVDNMCTNAKVLLQNPTLQVYLDGKLVFEENHSAMSPVKWYSLNITGKSEVKFFVSHRFDADFLGVFEVTLWQDANHQINENKPLARGEENIDDTCDVIRNYGYLEDYRLKPKGKTVTINNTTYDSGFFFSPSSGHSSENPFDGKRVTFNTFGRYKYVHFIFGHIDRSQYTGGVILDVILDNEVIKQIKFKQTDLPELYTVDVNYAHYITFVCTADYDTGGDRSSIGSVSGYGLVNITGSATKETSTALPKTIYDGSYKVLSEIGRPYNFVNAYDVVESVFKGESKAFGIQIGGVIYTEGLLMKSIFNIMTSTVDQIPASADFDLDNQFKYLTFKIGRKDRTAITNDKLKIYLDDVLKQEITLNSIATVQDVTVDLNYAKKLKLELVGSANTYRGTYGIVDIGLHTETIGELEFTHTPQTKRAALDSYNANTTVQLMKDLYAFDSLSKANDQSIQTDDRTDTAEYKQFGGREFTVATGQSYDMGFVLQVGTYRGFGFGDGPSVAILICGEPFLLALASQDVSVSSFASFAVREKFKTLEFDVCSLAGYQAGEVKKLKILGDDNVLKEVNLTTGTESHVEVDITGVTTLVFYLEYGEGCTTPFAFYNLYIKN